MDFQEQRGMNESADGSNSIGEMTIKMFCDLSGKVRSSAICGSVFSMPQSRHFARPVAAAGASQQSPRSCQQLTVAGGSSGQRAQVCAVKQRDAMGSDISNSSLTGHTSL